MVYPAGDVPVLTIGFLVLLRAAPELRLTLSLLVASAACAAVADSVWVYQAESAGSLSDILYTANALLMIVAVVAGYHAGAADPSAVLPPSWLFRWLPLVPLAAAALAAAAAP